MGQGGGSHVSKTLSLLSQGVFMSFPPTLDLFNTLRVNVGSLQLLIAFLFLGGGRGSVLSKDIPGPLQRRFDRVKRSAITSVMSILVL